MRIFLPFLLLMTIVGNAQIVNIPDANFKAKLISLGKDLNSDGEIQVSEAELVTDLYISNSNISNLDGILSFVNLVNLDCKYNSLQSLDVSNLHHLFNLDASHNDLTTLNVVGCSVLYFLNCRYNQLVALDLTNTNAHDLVANNNQLQSFTLPSTLWTYETFSFDHNQLASVDLSNVIVNSGDGIHLEYNNLQSINLQGTKANALWLQYNNLTSVDLTAFRRYGSNAYVNLAVNPNLQNVLAKNGQSENFSFMGDNSLGFVCADEFEIQQVQQQLVFNGIADVVVSPYCTFFPGGNFNTISGTVTFDGDNNGCDSTDPDQPYVKLNLSSGNNNYTVFTSPDGTFSSFGQTGTFNVAVAAENLSLFTITPPLATIIFGNNNNNVTTQDFCVTANGIQNDLETVIVPLTPARPGFDALYKITYKNKGNQVLSGNLDFSYQENELDFVNSSVVPAAQNPGMLSWNYANLYPFESRSIEVKLNVNSPQETPAVNIGDQLNFSVTGNPIASDLTPGDNSFAIKQVLIGSYDRNDITCLEGEHVNPTEIGKYLHYNVNFENTGTAAAENIVVKDMIDLTKFDISSLQILNASHAVTPRIENGKVEFIFEGINLGAGEHGNVTFKIKTKNTLVTGDSVSQKADIYFDYNFPVATNVAMTTFDSLGVEALEDNTVSVFPNPTTGIVRVSSEAGIRSIAVSDVTGRVLFTQNKSEVVDLSAYGSGIYLIKINTDKGTFVHKQIKR